MKCECGQYGMLLTTLADGTRIYYCVSCGKLWGERLVMFDVSFALAEHKGEDGQPAEPITLSIPVLAEAR